MFKERKDHSKLEEKRQGSVKKRQRIFFLRQRIFKILLLFFCLVVGKNVLCC